jgi:hypothetical protein
MKKIKKFLLKLLLNKKQREIIWQAMIFSEYTYRRRGNVDGAAVVQTVINETQSTFGVVKDSYSKEEVDYIVSKAIKDVRVESEKTIKDAYKKGVDSCRQELENAYQKGVDDTMAKIAAVGIVVSKINENDAEQKEEEEQKQDSSEGAETEGQETTGEDSQESEQEGQTTEEQEEKE